MKSCRLPGIPAIVLLLTLFLTTGCGLQQIPSHNYHPVTEERKLNRMGYTIQVGAFSKVENAARLVNCLNSDNLDAYYFLYKKGLYKVRFGSFESRELACKEAEILRAMGVIDEFYIVRPDDYSITKSQQYGETYFRNEIVKTAGNFIGVPYRWGGSSTEKGFDCSGLAMAVYRLNGLKLPRTSGEQYKTGTWVSRKNWQRVIWCSLIPAAVERSPMWEYMPAGINLSMRHERVERCAQAHFQTNSTRNDMPVPDLISKRRAKELLRLLRLQAKGV